MKRQHVLVTLFLIASLGIAQEQTSPSPTLRAWIALNEATYGSDEEAAAHLRYHGISDAGVEPLIKYVRAGQRELLELSTRATTNLCEHGSRFYGNPEMLAQEFERQEAEYYAAVKTLVENVGSVLKDSDRRNLDSMFEHMGRNMVSVPTDVPGVVRRGALTPEDAVNNACRAIESK